MHCGQTQGSSFSLTSKHISAKVNEIVPSRVGRHRIYQDSQFFQLYPRKRVSRDIYSLILRIDDASPIFFEQIVSFVQLSTQIQTHFSCFVKNKPTQQISQIKQFFASILENFT